MSTFIDTVWHGYKVSPRPQECWRRHVHHYHRYVPYLDGQQIGMRLTIKAPKRLTKQQRILCWWRVIRVSDNEEFGSGTIERDMLPGETYRTSLTTSLIEDTEKFKLLFRLTAPDIEPAADETPIAILPIGDWGEIGLSLVVVAITILLSTTLSALLSAAVSFFVTKAVM